MMGENATGKMIPPYVVYKSEGLWSMWTENSPKGSQYNRSKLGWFDAICFEDFFENLLLPTVKKKNGKKVIISDNLLSHIKCICSQIVQKTQHSFCLTATQLEPLDVVYFHPIKIAWQKILLSFKTGKGSRSRGLPKGDFPRLLKELLDALDESNRAANVILRFQKAKPFTMLHNWNVAWCLNKTAVEYLKENWKGPFMEENQWATQKKLQHRYCDACRWPRAQCEDKETYIEKTSLPQKAHKQVNKTKRSNPEVHEKRYLIQSTLKNKSSYGMSSSKILRINRLI